MSEQTQSHAKPEGSRCPFSGKSFSGTAFSGTSFSGTSFNPFASDVEALHPLLAQARREQPVFFSEPLHSWVVTRHEDSYAILQDPRRFSSEMDESIFAALHPEARAMLEEGGYRRTPLVSQDGAAHARSRHIVARLFDKDAVAAMEPLVRSLTEALVDGFIREGTGDLVQHFTYPLPIRVIFSWLGLPLERLEQFKDGSQALVRILSSYPMTLEEQKACVRSVLEMQQCVAEFISERVAHPREDGLTVLAQRLSEEASLDAKDLAAFVMLLITAGHETTTGLLGVAVRLLAERPGMWARLRAEPHLIERVVEEVLRLESPMTAVIRRVTEEVEVGGVKLPAGARVMLFLPSGNRDEARFVEPERFEPGRANVRQHLTFGKGVHTCVGAQLARLEARVALEVLTRRLQGVRLVEAPQAVPGLVRHYRQLMLAWEPVSERQAA
jgi:cytochrome P450